ncbi:MAG: methyltransferase domain-containing protein [Chloroflexi bacterium]|nr:MAG: methyltransferase domain-containing protein [Chloroflexota bacterium]
MSDALTFDDEQTRQIVALYTTPDVAAQRDYTLRLLNLQAGEKVLDIGSGPGFLAHSMADIVGEGGAVHGVDVSASMLSVAEQQCADQSWVTFHDADATDLPFDDNTFDAAITTQVWEYVNDVAAAAAELQRVLRPGGRALILDTDWDTAIWPTADADRMRHIMQVWESHCAHARLPRYLTPILRDAGLSVTTHDVYVLLNTEYNADTYSYTAVKIISQYVANRDGITQETIDAWLNELQQLADDDAYFFSNNRYIFMVEKSR